MNTQNITDFRHTPTGPVARVDGIWHSVNGLYCVQEIRYPLSQREIDNLHAEEGRTPDHVELDQIVFWHDQTARVLKVTKTHVLLRLNDGTTKSTSRKHVFASAERAQRYSLRLRESVTPLRLDQTVYWRNAFGITNSGRVEQFDDTFVTVRLPDDEETRQAETTITLSRAVVSTTRP